ncbi:MAG TPA: hypothetical protein DCS93_40275 [Microscillaceae bacterium]|nr:hypothetical protein [Microscillaceae bacterium]
MNKTTQLTEVATRRRSFSDKFLKNTVRCWFIMAVLGQWIFAIYVSGFYAGNAINGNFEEWKKALPHGLGKGDPVGNAAIMIHVFLAIIIIVGGPLQFVPYLQRKFRKFHRWNGRIYTLMMFLVSTAGLYMVWITGSGGGPFQYAGLTLDTILIFWFGILAWRTAIKRKFVAHSRWAFRLFLAGIGVWFARVGYMAWVLLHQGFGFNSKTYFTEFFDIWSFAQYLLPLLLFEIYIRVKSGSRKTPKYVLGGTLILFTLIMVVGIFGATIGIWIPLLR